MRVAMVFPGQGTQVTGMGAPWQDHPAWKLFDEAERALDEPLRSLVLDAPVASRSVTSDPRDLVALLPHRPPFRFVDTVDANEPGVSTRARYRVRGDEEFLAGHFPGNPVFPGVLQLEALAQAGALLAHESAPFDPSQKVILLLAFDDVKFRRVVSPGDRLDLHVAIDRQKGSFWRLAGQAKVDGQLASEAEIMATIADRKEQK